MRKVSLLSLLVKRQVSVSLGAAFLNIEGTGTTVILSLAPHFPSQYSVLV